MENIDEDGDGRKEMLIPKGVELLQLPDYIPPRKDVWLDGECARTNTIPEYAPLPCTSSNSSHPHTPSFTLNLGVEESPLGALTPLTPPTPGGRWFDPIQGDHEYDLNKGTQKPSERNGEYIDGDCAIWYPSSVPPMSTS